MVKFLIIIIIIIHSDIRYTTATWQAGWVGQQDFTRTLTTALKHKTTICSFFYEFWIFIQGFQPRDCRASTGTLQCDLVSSERITTTFYGRVESGSRNNHANFGGNPIVDEGFLNSDKDQKIFLNELFGQNMVRRIEQSLNPLYWSRLKRQGCMILAEIWDLWSFQVTCSCCCQEFNHEVTTCTTLFNSEDLCTIEKERRQHCSNWRASIVHRFMQHQQLKVAGFMTYYNVTWDVTSA